ncbi:hypothetical protein PG991_003564 [Apiospora marii]|uniref:Uncharacterized protein n=1 Tax=Apiospora marii TaxID=335849 RepID=A0ABR1S410_9PEZI
MKERAGEAPAKLGFWLSVGLPFQSQPSVSLVAGGVCYAIQAKYLAAIVSLAQTETEKEMEEDQKPRGCELSPLVRVRSNPHHGRVDDDFADSVCEPIPIGLVITSAAPQSSRVCSFSTAAPNVRWREAPRKEVACALTAQTTDVWAERCSLVRGEGGSFGDGSEALRTAAVPPCPLPESTARGRLAADLVLPFPDRPAGSTRSPVHHMYLSAWQWLVVLALPAAAAVLDRLLLPLPHALDQVVVIRSIRAKPPGEPTHCAAPTASSSAVWFRRRRLRLSQALSRSSGPRGAARRPGPGRRPLGT